MKKEYESPKGEVLILHADIIVTSGAPDSGKLQIGGNGSGTGDSDSFGNLFG